MGFFDKIKSGLAKTRDALGSTLGSVFSGFSEADLAKGSVAAWEGVCFWNTVAGFCCTR